VRGRAVVSDQLSAEKSLAWMVEHVRLFLLGMANFVGFPKDLTTEYTEITEKKLIKISVRSVISVVKGFLSPFF